MSLANVAKKHGTPQGSPWWDFTFTNGPTRGDDSACLPLVTSSLRASPSLVAWLLRPRRRLRSFYTVDLSHVKIGHYLIPFVQHSLKKDCEVQGISRLVLCQCFSPGPPRSERLSEGVTPASFILQEKYSGTSTDEWTIAVFDILLVLADSYEDAKNHH